MLLVQCGHDSPLKQKFKAISAHRRRSATQNCLSVGLSHLEKGGSFEVLRTTLTLVFTRDLLSPSILKGTNTDNRPALQDYRELSASEPVSST